MCGATVMAVRAIGVNCADCGEELTAHFSGVLWDEIECHHCHCINIVSFDVFVSSVVVDTEVSSEV